MSYPKGIIDRAFNKAPGEAVSYLEGKVAEETFDWYQLNELAHNKAFTVAKMASADALEATKSALENSLKNGETFEKFQKNIRGTLSRSGWLNSDERDRIIAPYRLKNIYRTNIQQAYNAGRESRIQRHNKTHPYSEYIAVMDSVTRPSHSALNGLIVANDDEFWTSFTPSNGYSCRCRRRGLSQKKIDRKGLKITSFKNKIGSKEVFVNKSKGIKTEVAQTTVNGKKISPDAGFSSSPLSGFTPDLKRYPNPMKTQLKNELKTAPKIAKDKSNLELSKIKK